MAKGETLIQKHGGYNKLKSFQLAQLVFDVTVVFSERYVERFSRTRDQMVQAARSGVQNIAEGSVASATSTKTEIRLTQVARASLEELKLDYKDFLRQSKLPELMHDHPTLLRFKDMRCENLREFQEWVRREDLDASCLVANGALSLLNITCYLLDRQVRHLAERFENEGGFSERLYRVRKARR